MDLLDGLISVDTAYGFGKEIQSMSREQVTVWCTVAFY